MFCIKVLKGLYCEEDYDKLYIFFGYLFFWKKVCRGNDWFYIKGNM